MREQRASRFREVCAERGATFAGIARATGIGFSTVCAAGRGLIPGESVRSRIAAHLGVDAEDVWPRVTG
jgi:hypothetical protein